MDVKDGPPPRATRPPRRRSDKRRAQDRITFRVLPAERAEIEADAGAAERTLGSYIRSRLLAATATPPRRRPSLEAALLTRILAELKREGNNINQIALHANTGGLLEAGELRAMQVRHDRAIVVVLDALGRGPGAEAAK
jgi:hypothetical protein